jgi:hypothetical protein
MLSELLVVSTGMKVYVLAYSRRKHDLGSRQGVRSSIEECKMSL